MFQLASKSRQRECTVSLLSGTAFQLKVRHNRTCVLRMLKVWLKERLAGHGQQIADAGDHRCWRLVYRARPDIREPNGVGDWWNRCSPPNIRGLPGPYSSLSLPSPLPFPHLSLLLPLSSAFPSHLLSTSVYFLTFKVHISIRINHSTRIHCGRGWISVYSKKWAKCFYTKIICHRSIFKIFGGPAWAPWARRHCGERRMVLFADNSSGGQTQVWC